MQSTNALNLGLESFCQHLKIALIRKIHAFFI